MPVGYISIDSKSTIVNLKSKVQTADAPVASFIDVPMIKNETVWFNRSLDVGLTDNIGVFNL